MPHSPKSPSPSLAYAVDASASTERAHDLSHADCVLMLHRMTTPTAALSALARWTSSFASTGREDLATSRPRSTAACGPYPSPSAVPPVLGNGE